LVFIGWFMKNTIFLIPALFCTTPILEFASFKTATITGYILRWLLFFGQLLNKVRGGCMRWVTPVRFLGMAQLKQAVLLLAGRQVWLLKQHNAGVKL